MVRTRGEDFIYVCGVCGDERRWCALARMNCRCGHPMRCQNAPEAPLRYCKDSSYLVFTRKRIRVGKGRERAVWQPVKDNIRDMKITSLYLTCPACSKIVDFTEHLITPPGRVEDCVVCPSCLAHFFAFLEGWKG